MKMTLLLIGLMSLSLIVSACGSADLNVQAISPADATADAMALAKDSSRIGPGQQDGWLSYANERFGLTFDYPETWTLEENQNAVVLRRAGVLLTIGFKLKDDPISLQDEQPTGEWIVGDPTVLLFLGQVVARTVLEQDGLIKAVSYGAPREISNMVFAAYAELEASAAETGSITADLQTEIDRIVISVDLKWVALPLPDSAMASWETYINDDYGFSVRYPPTWTLEVTSGAGQLGPGNIPQGDALTLSKGTALLYIGFKHTGEDLFISWSGVGAGEMQKGDPIFAVIAGQEVPRIHVMYEEMATTILYGNSGGPALEIEDMNFAMRLDAMPQQDENGFRPEELSQETRDEADHIITSLTLAPR